jgi:hypothetical protein
VFRERLAFILSTPKDEFPYLEDNGNRATTHMLAPINLGRDVKLTVINMANDANPTPSS